MEAQTTPLPLAAPWLRPALRALLGLMLALGGASCGDDEPGAVAPEQEPDEELPEQEEFDPGNPVDVRQSFLEGLCQEFCAGQEACGDGGQACVEACAQEVTEPSGLARVRCAATLGCQDDDACQQTPASDRDCDALCDRVTACEGFPSDFFGPDEATCAATCSGFAHAHPEAREDELSCYYGLLRNNCQIDDVGRCQLDLGPEDTCAEMCGRLINECSAIPGPSFVTLGECLDSCREAPLTDQITMNVCASTSGCDLYPRCFPPLTETPTECSPLCGAINDKCPGALPPTICPSWCRGVRQGLPGSDLALATECVEAADGCPGEALFLCLLPEFDGCETICGALEGCGFPAPDCAQGCRYLAAIDPDNTARLETCAAESECNTLGACFQ